MKVILASPLPNLGGTEKQTLALCELLVQAGHSVRILGSPGPLTDQARRLADHYAPLAPLSLLRAAMGADMLHCQMARTLPLACLAKIWCWLLGQPLGLVWHARAIRPRSYPLVISLCHLFGIVVIANSRAEQAKLATKGLRPGLNMQANNIPPQTAPPDTARKLPNSLLVVARLDKARGVDHVLKAFSLARTPDAKLTIIGDGPERDTLQALSFELGLERYVEFKGQQSDPGPSFATASILINTPLMTSDFGAGHGNALIEGAFAGCALISYDGSSAGELAITGKTGALIKTGDLPGLTQAIAGMLASPTQARCLGEAARARAQDLFAPNKSLGVIEQAYAKAYGPGADVLSAQAA